MRHHVQNPAEMSSTALRKRLAFAPARFHKRAMTLGATQP
jgi:hypothetical protein